jgi:predicted dehydrogenase
VEAGQTRHRRRGRHSIQITRVSPFPPRMGECGCVVIDLAVHDIDIIRHLTAWRDR